MIPKFRAWLKYDKEMKNVIAFDTRGHSFLGIEGPHVTVDGWCDNFEVGKQAELMQSTGLKDKNGVEIFEGDIVVIEYSRVGYRYYEKIIYENGAFLAGDDDWLFNVKDSCVVCGNIYENPELLEPVNEI